MRYGLPMAETETIPARGKGRPKLTEAADIDRAIGDAALKILLEQGEGATMNAIAVAAGVSRKSLYARFSNKTELFLAAIPALLAEVRSLEYHPSGNAEQRLRGFIEQALEVISRPKAQALQRLLAMDGGYAVALRSDITAASHALFHQPLHALLSEASERGEFVIEDIEATTLAVMRLVFAESMALGADASSTDPAAYAAFLTKLVANGLKPRAS